MIGFIVPLLAMARWISWLCCFTFLCIISVGVWFNNYHGSGFALWSWSWKLYLGPYMDMHLVNIIVNLYDCVFGYVSVSQICLTIGLYWNSCGQSERRNPYCVSCSVYTFLYLSVCLQDSILGFNDLDLWFNVYGFVFGDDALGFDPGCFMRYDGSIWLEFHMIQTWVQLWLIIHWFI